MIKFFNRKLQKALDEREYELKGLHEKCVAIQRECNRLELRNIGLEDQMRRIADIASSGRAPNATVKRMGKIAIEHIDRIERIKE